MHEVRKIHKGGVGGRFILDDKVKRVHEGKG